LENTDFLLTMAELAIAIVAFATIILVFRQSIGSELTRLQVLATRSIVELSLAIAVFSLLPIVLGHAGVTSATLWRVSNGTFGTFLVAFWVAYAERRRRATKAGDPARGFTFFTVVGGGGLVGVFLLFDGVWWGRFSAYSFALLWSLVAASLAFVWSLSVFASPPSSDD
jgi:hypothetical protein